MASYEEEGMASYEEEGLYLDLGELGRLQVCVKQYANRTTDEGSYVQHLHEYDGRMVVKVVVPPHMWIGVDIYHTLGSYSSIKGGIPYEWVLVDRHGVERVSDIASRGAGTWAVHKTWESTAPDRIRLDTARPTEQWVVRESLTKRTLLMIQFTLPA